MCEKVRAVEARRPFGPIWRFRAVLENTPGVQSQYKAAITKNGWFNFWAQGSNLEDYFRLACDDSRDGRGRKTHEQHTPRGPWRGYRGGFFSLILISLLEMRSTRFEARGLGRFEAPPGLPSQPESDPMFLRDFGFTPADQH